MSAHVRRRVWVPAVAVGESVLRARLDVLRARRVGELDPEADAVDAGVRTLLDKAANAAYRIDPKPRHLPNWWRGTLYDAGFQNLHAAEAEIVMLYDPGELRAELPEALARVEEGLQADDPRRAEAQRVATSTDPLEAPVLRKMIETGHAAADQLHARVRSFRNVVLIAASLITIFLIAFAAYVSTHPSAVPLCFRSVVAQTTEAPTGAAAPAQQVRTVCPTSESPEGQGGPAGRDILVVGLLGLMGAGLASAVSLRNVKGTSTPYSVPVALAFLKAPTGALTAIAALIAIRGDFVPGLSSLDSQEQIIAYALVFGYAQQLFTGLVDKQGQSILSSVPSKDATGSRPSTAGVTGVAGTVSAADGSAADDLPDDDADDSDVPDPEPRDTAEATIVDDQGIVEELPDDDDEDGDDVDAEDAGEAGTGESAVDGAAGAGQPADAAGDAGDDAGADSADDADADDSDVDANAQTGQLPKHAGPSVTLPSDASQPSATSGGLT
jgi:hypothetical protein